MLWRKMVRDLWENKLAYLACIAVISIGILTFTSFFATYNNLTTARDIFYRDYNLADGFAEVAGIPHARIKHLSHTEGIDEIEGRIVKDVRVLLPDRKDSIYLRLVSVNPEDRRPLNAVKLIEGQPLDNESMSILLSPDFFEANALNIGDALPVIIGGRKVDLDIAGVGQSPEFVYVMQPGAGFLPTPETFGIAYIPLGTMETIFRGRKLINDLVFTTSPGHTYEAVEDRLRPQLKEYGLKAIYPREDLLSYSMLNLELDGLRGSATTQPVMFLVVAAAILYITVKRLVEQQRTQIGTMKAFGYPEKQILLHYIAYSLLISFLGGAAGALLGGILSIPLTIFYLEWFILPHLDAPMPFNYFFLGIALASAFGLLAGYLGSKKVLNLQPAEAMRPSAPPSAKKTLLEQVTWFWRAVHIQGKMALRNLFRNKARSFFVFLGIMFTFFMMAVTWYFYDLMHVSIFAFFDRGRAYNARATFSSPTAPEQMEREFYRTQGVNKVESVLDVPATFKHKWLEEDAVIIGFRQDAQLFNVLDENDNPIIPPSDGLILSKRLAELLNAELGSHVTMETIWDKDSLHRLEVIDIVPQYLGLNAYMEQEALSRLINHENVATASLLYMERGSIPLLRDKYRESAIVASITDREGMVTKYKEMLEAAGFAVWLMATIAVIAGFAIVYNASIVSFSERKRELASLRVLGMSPKEVFQVITFEQWFISFFGMLGGIPLTIILVNMFSQAMSTDAFTMPVAIRPFTFIWGISGTASSIWIAQYIVFRKIKSLSLVEVLKERD